MCSLSHCIYFYFKKHSILNSKLKSKHLERQKKKRKETLCVNSWLFCRHSVTFKAISGESNLVQPKMIALWCETSLPTLRFQYDHKTPINDHKPPANHQQTTTDYQQTNTNYQQTTTNGHPCTSNQKSGVSFLLPGSGNYTEHPDFEKHFLQCQISVGKVQVVGRVPTKVSSAGADPGLILGCCQNFTKKLNIEMMYYVEKL